MKHEEKSFFYHFLDEIIVSNIFHGKRGSSDTLWLDQGQYSLPEVGSSPSSVNGERGKRRESVSTPIKPWSNENGWWNNILPRIDFFASD